MVDEDCEFEVSQEFTGQPGHLLPVPLPDDFSLANVLRRIVKYLLEVRR